MISFAEFYGLIPKTQDLELHVIEDKNHFDVDHFDLDSDDLHYPWHTYAVVTTYAYYDRDKNDTIMHALISYRGEDNNNDEEE